MTELRGTETGGMVTSGTARQGAGGQSAGGHGTGDPAVGGVLGRLRQAGLIFGLCATLGLAACGDGGSDPAPDPQPQPQPDPDPEPDPDPDPEPDPEPEEPLDPEGTRFSFLPPGDLIPGSGMGLVDFTVYQPGMRFPFESAPAFPNSQVWGYGGYKGPGGGQCNPANYDYPWRDNFCETRTWTNALCPAGQGHQGQDIRPATCDDETYWLVAAEDGEIVSVSSYTVTLLGDSGTSYRYMHMAMDKLPAGISVGSRVSRGDRMGLASNDFGGSATTIHLHIDMKQNLLLPDGTTSFTFVPPYMSLVESYRALLNGTP